MTRFSILFVLLISSTFWVYVTQWGQRWMAEPVTSFVAAISSHIMVMFDPNVISQGIIILDRTTGYGVQVVAGCNGMEAVLILFAALFAFPSTWKQKFIGFSAGFIAIHALNVVRIISLFYIGQWDYNWFEWFHLYLWQALIILDALVVWLLWLRWINKAKRDKAQALTAIPT